MCRDTSGHAWEVTDESGDKAQVTYCGYVVSDSALGTLADSGNVYVDAVFMVTDHLSAGFDTNSIVADSRDGNYLYIGQCNGNAAASGCIRVASGGGAYYAINAAGTVISNEAEFPLANEASPVIIVMITQMPEGDSTGPMIFAVNSSSGGHGPNRVQLYSSGEQQLPINF